MLGGSELALPHEVSTTLNRRAERMGLEVKGDSPFSMYGAAMVKTGEHSVDGKVRWKELAEQMGQLLLQIYQESVPESFEEDWCLLHNKWRREFWYNKRTQESRWEKPPNLPDYLRAQMAALHEKGDCNVAGYHGARTDGADVDAHEEQYHDAGAGMGMGTGGGIGSGRPGSPGIGMGVSESPPPPAARRAPPRPSSSPMWVQTRRQGGPRATSWPSGTLPGWRTGASRPWS